METGVLLIGFLGGFASSTATTIALSPMAKQGQGQTKILATAIALATGTMAPRLLLQIAVINSSLAKQLAIPLIILGLTPILIALIFIWRGIKEKNQEVPITLSNPVELGLAVQYALKFMSIINTIAC